jgi:hypothetical protein
MIDAEQKAKSPFAFSSFFVPREKALHFSFMFNNAFTLIFGHAFYTELFIRRCISNKLPERGGSAPEGTHISCLAGCSFFQKTRLATFGARCIIDWPHKYARRTALHFRDLHSAPTTPMR